MIGLQFSDLQYEQKVLGTVFGVPVVLQKTTAECSFFDVELGGGIKLKTGPGSDLRFLLGCKIRCPQRMTGFVESAYGPSYDFDINIAKNRPDICGLLGFKYAWKFTGRLHMSGEIYGSPVIKSGYKVNYDPGNDVNAPRLNSAWGLRLGLELELLRPKTG